MKYEDICDFETLYKAYKSARLSKRGKAQEARYEQNVVENTLALVELLKSGKYMPGKFQTFYVYEPKKRLVQSPAFVDKVVQHALVDNGFYEEITRSFVYDNAASQKNKGTFFALEGLKTDLLDYYRKNKTAEGWVLKCDIRHFFASINHDILKQKLAHKIEDTEILRLLFKYIDACEEGLPLGYQTSQLFALLYLDKFDHYIKDVLRVKYYGRYMDDFYIILSDKEQLKVIRNKIAEYLGHLDLELNEKTKIFPIKNGIDYLGFHTYLTESGKVIRKLRKTSVDRMRARIKYWEKAYPAGEISKEKILQRFDAFDAHAAHGDTFSLRKKFAERVGDILFQEVYIRKAIKTPGKKAPRIKIGKSEKERIDDWYVKNIILQEV